AAPSSIAFSATVSANAVAPPPNRPQRARTTGTSAPRARALPAMGRSGLLFRPGATVRVMPLHGPGRWNVGFRGESRTSHLGGRRACDALERLPLSGTTRVSSRQHRGPAAATGDTRNMFRLRGGETAMQIGRFRDGIINRESAYEQNRRRAAGRA